MLLPCLCLRGGWKEASPSLGHPPGTSPPHPVPVPMRVCHATHHSPSSSPIHHPQGLLLVFRPRCFLLFATNVNYLLIASKQRLSRVGREPAKGIYSPGQWDMEPQLLLAGCLLEFLIIPPDSKYLLMIYLGHAPEWRYPVGMQGVIVWSPLCFPNPQAPALLSACNIWVLEVATGHIPGPSWLAAEMKS